MCELYHGDCLDIIDKLISNGVKVDAIITDPPYGTTACKWDSVIPFPEMWERLNKLIKPNGAIVLFGSEPFSSYLRMSNIKNYKYDWVWDKKIPSGMSYSRFQPMRQNENICVFNSGIYYPQMILRNEPITAGGMTKGETTNNTKLKALKKTYHYKFPINIICFDKIRQDSVHPTQKPVKLMEYLIKTYTNENELVLDFTMGSGTTGVACKQLNRKFIGIELDEKIFDMAEERINKAVRQFELFKPEKIEKEILQPELLGVI